MKPSDFCVIQYKKSVTKFIGKKCKKKTAFHSAFGMLVTCNMFQMHEISVSVHFGLSAVLIVDLLNFILISYTFSYLHREQNPNIKFDMDFHKMMETMKLLPKKKRKKKRAQWTSFLRVYLLINDGRKMKFALLYEVWRASFLPFSCALCAFMRLDFLLVWLLLAFAQLWIIVVMMVRPWVTDLFLNYNLFLNLIALNLILNVFILQSQRIL